AFPNRLFFLAKSSVDQTQNAHCRTVAWLILHDFLLLGASRSESRSRSRIVVAHASDHTFHALATEENILAAENNWFFAGCNQSMFSGTGVPFGQCAQKPGVG